MKRAGRKSSERIAKKNSFSRFVNTESTLVILDDEGANEEHVHHQTGEAGKHKNTKGNDSTKKRIAQDCADKKQKNKDRPTSRYGKKNASNKRKQNTIQPVAPILKKRETPCDSDLDFQSSHVKRQRMNEDGKSSKNKGFKKFAQKKNELPTSTRYYGIRTRTSPRTLFTAIDSLTMPQRQSVKDMGFDGILHMKVDGIPSKLGFYVVDRFDPDAMVLRTNQGCISVTKEAIHDMIGAPIGGLDLFSINSDNIDESIEEDWKKQFGKSDIRPSDVMRQICFSEESGWTFKMNFIVLFCNTMAKCKGNGVCDLTALSYIRKDTDIGKIDWCNYVLHCLKGSKARWKKDAIENFYSGPLTFLSVLYVDSVKCEKLNVVRQRPAIKCWSMELMRQREAAEIASGGFGMGDLEGPLEQTCIEDAGQIGLEGGRLKQATGEKNESPGCPSSPSDLEGYLSRLDATWASLLEAKLQLETTLQEAMSKFPDVYEIKQWEVKLKNLFAGKPYRAEATSWPNDHDKAIILYNPADSLPIDLEAKWVLEQE